MMNVFTSLAVLLAQIETPGGTEDVATNAAKDNGSFGTWNCLFLAMIPLMLIYFLMMSKPQAKEQAKAKEMLANLKKNDRVVTAGGIFGVVVNVNPESESVTIRIDESNNTKIVLLKSSISRVITEATEKDTTA